MAVSSFMYEPYGKGLKIRKSFYDAISLKGLPSCRNVFRISFESITCFQMNIVHLFLSILHCPFTDHLLLTNSLLLNCEVYNQYFF